MSPLKRPWRSLQELSADPQFLEEAAREFPGLERALAQGVDRRRVLKLMAAALAMNGLAGCDLGEPRGKIVPAVTAPPGITPGRPNFYASVHSRAGFGTGVVITHRMGRPTQVSGNPHHPASLGAVDAFGAAMPLDFYDPDRNAGMMRDGAPVGRGSLENLLAERRERWARTAGAGLRILTGAVTSMTLNAQLDRLSSRYPEARWHRFEPCGRDALYEGHRIAYGTPVDCAFDLTSADVLVGFDSDLISAVPGHLRYARDFAARRNPTRTTDMNRVYAVEPTPTLLGAAADHRFIAGPHELGTLLLQLQQRVVTGQRPEQAPAWLEVIAQDLLARRGRALVHVGELQPPHLHALAAAINARLDAPGHTLRMFTPVERNPLDADSSLATLVADMHAGKVDTLIILESNPVYAASPSLGFAAALKRVPVSIALSIVPDETSIAARWSLPLRHAWEDWSDARAFDGTASLQQPQAAPLFDGLSAHEFMESLWDERVTDSEALVRAAWSGLSDERWQQALARGVIDGSAARTETPVLRERPATPAPGYGDALTVLHRPDPHVWDGRYANNPWLQELPRPLTKLTWDNPLLISPALARTHQLANGEHVRLTVGTTSLEAPVWIVPGQAADTVVALLGFGRNLGQVAAGAGWNYVPLLGLEGAVKIDKVPGHTALACTEHHALLVETASEIVRHGTLEAFQRDPRSLSRRPASAEIYHREPPGPAAWGMSIDLNACIGCNACVIACQSENNIPTVGREQVLAQREMHWLRIDRYFEGSVDEPQMQLQPMLCMHCEQAPCETVCPVGATVHDDEGLNVMVYNRCVGTRFCSNNCPYKVRRFNYFPFAQREHRAPESRNPEVSVRTRGVMEKCTFCIQRIAAARADADRDNQGVGVVTTACQDACPARAISFGNLAQPDSDILARKHSPLNYALLEDENTHPRVTYEAHIRNPHPDLEGKS